MARSKLNKEEVQAVKNYKSILKEILDQRPAGTRQRLAIALGTTRSFVTQITNPAYSVPIPAQHIPVIAQVCQFTTEDLARFSKAHGVAHPEQMSVVALSRPTRTISLAVPDFKDSKKNRQLEAMLADFVREMSNLFDPK